MNVHTSAHTGGEVRGQIELVPVPNHPDIDEIDNRAHDGSHDPTGTEADYPGFPILYYPGVHNLADGTVGMIHRDQPSLENPGITYHGRSAYTTFGLEGISNTFNPGFGITPTMRAELLGTLLDWAWSEPATAIITDITPSNASQLTILTATLQSGVPVSYRWDFGDDTPYTAPQETPGISHTYVACRTYTVRVEITDIYGNVSIGSKDIAVEENCTSYEFSLPQIYKNATP